MVVFISVDAHCLYGKYRASNVGYVIHNVIVCGMMYHSLEIIMWLFFIGIEHTFVEFKNTNTKRVLGGHKEQTNC